MMFRRVSSSLAALACALSSVACGSGSTGGPFSQPDATTSTPDAAMNGGDAAPGPDSGAADTSAPADAAKPPTDTGAPPVDSGNCDRPDGGYACDPGSIYCNNAPCSTSANYCCVQGSTSTCTPSNDSCSGGDSLHCDEISDCPQGDICCFVASSASAGDTVCASSCQGGLYAIQICRTDSECGPGNSCIVQNCSGAVIEACGNIPGCT